MMTIEQYRSMLVDAENDLRESEARTSELNAVVAFIRRQIHKLDGSGSTPALPGIGQPVFSNMKMAAAIRHILESHGRPLHVRDIAQDLVRGGWPQSNSLRVSVASTCRREREVFRKTSPNTWGLIQKEAKLITA